MRFRYAAAENWFPVMISAWVAAIYAERIIVDLMVRNSKPFWTSVSSSIFVVFFLIEWLLVLWAFKLEERDVPRIRTQLARLFRKYRKELLSGVSGAVMLYLFFKALFLIDKPSVFDLIWLWLKELFEEAVQVLPGLALIFFLYGLYRLVSRLLRGKNRVYVEFRQWTLSLIPILFGLFIYIVLYRFLIFTKISEDEMTFEVWKGLIKDSLIYTLVALVLVQGLYRYRLCCGEFRHPYAKWWGYAGMAGVTAILVALALAGDLVFLDQLHKQASPEYPNSQFRPIIQWHVVIRDWLIMLPLVFTMFLWLAGEMIGAWNVLKKRPARRTSAGGRH
jgi:hypothetical protein